MSAPTVIRLAPGEWRRLTVGASTLAQAPIGQESTSTTLAVETIGRLADLSVAHAALRAAVEKYPGKHISLRERARIIKRHDEIE